MAGSDWEISIERLLEAQVHAIQDSWDDAVERKKRFVELMAMSAGIVAGLKEAKRER